MEDFVVMATMFYDNVDPRKRQDQYEGRMVQENQSAPSNLPQKAINQLYDQHKYTQRLNMYNQSQKFRG